MEDSPGNLLGNISSSGSQDSSNAKISSSPLKRYLIISNYQKSFAVQAFLSFLYICTNHMHPKRQRIFDGANATSSAINDADNDDSIVYSLKKINDAISICLRVESTLDKTTIRKYFKKFTRRVDQILTSNDNNEQDLLISIMKQANVTNGLKLNGKLRKMETRIELEKEEFIPFIIDEKIKQIWSVSLSCIYLAMELPVILRIKVLCTLRHI
jgi:hypothetical protein